MATDGGMEIDLADQTTPRLAAWMARKAAIEIVRKNPLAALEITGVKTVATAMTQAP